MTSANPFNLREDTPQVIDRQARLPLNCDVSSRYFLRGVFSPENGRNRHPLLLITPTILDSLNQRRFPSHSNSPKGSLTHSRKSSSVCTPSIREPLLFRHFVSFRIAHNRGSGASGFSPIPFPRVSLWLPAWAKPDLCAID
jgi:hypothetical protein